MGTAELVEQLRRLSNPERFAVIEAATRLVRDDIVAGQGARQTDRERQEQRLRAAAESVKDLYEPGGELTEWTSLDGEELHDDPLQG